MQDIEHFAKRLKQAIEAGLPGREAQYKMAVADRITKVLETFQSRPHKNGGVLVYFYPHHDEIHVLLTLRHEYKGVHSGQISFPGGKEEEGDKDIIFTAIREAREEAGIDIKPRQIIGRLSELYIPPSNFMVYPTIAFETYRPVFMPDPFEVKDIIELPISYLMNEKVKTERKVNLTGGISMNVPAYELKDGFIWGATAMILSELVELIKRDKLIS